ncbi:hypothetical protein ACWGDE_20690 [Streptomyces sp. NPDC054956]
MTGGSWLLEVAWGTGATALGLVLATDFRGLASWFDYRWPRHLGVGGVRLTGCAFALAGPVMLVLGLVSAARHGFGEVLTARLSVPAPLFIPTIGPAALVLWAGWRRPRGVFRQLAAAGGRLCRGALVALSATLPAFAVCLAVGYPAAVLACWLTGVCAMLTAVVALPLDWWPDEEPEQEP